MAGGLHVPTKNFRISDRAWTKFGATVQKETDPAMRSRSAILRRFIDCYNLDVFDMIRSPYLDSDDDE